MEFDEKGVATRGNISFMLRRQLSKRIEKAGGGGQHFAHNLAGQEERDDGVSERRTRCGRAVRQTFVSFHTPMNQWSTEQVFEWLGTWQLPKIFNSIPKC